MNYTTILTPVLNVVLVIMGGFIVKEIVKFYPMLEAFIVARTGLERYNKIKAVALDIWNKIEEDSRLKTLSISKLNLFENYMRRKFPALTDEEINLFNKSLAGEFNKCKVEVVKELDVVVGPIETPII